MRRPVLLKGPRSPAALTRPRGSTHHLKSGTHGGLGRSVRTVVNTPDIDSLLERMFHTSGRSFFLGEGGKTRTSCDSGT